MVTPRYAVQYFLFLSALKGDNLGNKDNMAMGKRIMAIQRRSYFKPSQKADPSSSTPIDSGLKKITVAIRKAVNMHRYIMNSLTIHCMVLGTRLLMSMVNYYLSLNKEANIQKQQLEV